MPPTKYSGDWPSIPHSHSYAELFYIVDGEGQFQINDRLFPVRAHQLVVVNPNVIHTEVSFESHPLEYIVLGYRGVRIYDFRCLRGQLLRLYV
ncbi:MAG: cupin domain-containing protein [Subdoligranulum sp.]